MALIFDSLLKKWIKNLYFNIIKISAKFQIYKQQDVEF